MEGGPRLGRTVNCTGIILAPIYQTSENTIDYTVPPCSTNRIDLLQPAGADDAMTTLLQTSSLHRLLSRDRRRLPLHSPRCYIMYPILGSRYNYYTAITTIVHHMYLLQWVRWTPRCRRQQHTLTHMFLYTYTHTHKHNGR